MAFNSDGVRSLRNLSDFNGIFQPLLDKPSLGDIMAMVVRYAPQAIHRGKLFSQRIITFVEQESKLDERDRWLVTQMSAWQLLQKSASSKSKREKEQIPASMTIVSLKRHHWHQCLVENCPDKKNKAFTCALREQCLMKADPELHTAVPWYAIYGEKPDREEPITGPTVCAFCVRHFLKPFFQTASDAFYQKRAVRPGMLEFYQHFEFQNPVGMRSSVIARCCECGESSSEMTILTLSALLPRPAWHCFCNDCFVERNTGSGLQEAQTCDGCGFDWEADELQVLKGQLL